MARTPARMGQGEGGSTLPQLGPLFNDIALDLDDIMNRDRGIRVLTLTAQQAATASTTGVHAAVQDDGVGPQVITTAITNPPYPRNITATSGGTAADIAAVQVLVEGTNVDDEPITETLPAFTENSATTVVGNKAFKTVSEITIPAHDDTGATTAIGFGDKLGLPEALATNTILFANLNGVREGTLPTVAVHASEVENNTADLASVLNGTAVALGYVGVHVPESRRHLASDE